MPTAMSDSKGLHPQAATERSDPFADIIALARSVTSRTRLHRESLNVIVRHFQSPYGAIHVRYAAEVIQDDAHSGPGDPNFWKSAVQQFLTESLADGRSSARLLKSRSGDARVALLAAPIYDPSGPAVGALALITNVSDDAEWTARLAALEALCRLVSFCCEFVGPQKTGAGDSRQGDSALAKAAACESVEQFAFAVTNELCNRMDCNQVALALAERNHVRILSISGLDQIGDRSPGAASLRAAMEECLDAESSIVFPREEAWSEQSDTGDHRLHKQWHGASKGDAVASIPLFVDDRVVAVVSLRRSRDQGLSREQLDQLSARLATLVPALMLARKAHRSAIRHFADSVVDSWHALLSPGRMGRKLCAAGLAIAIVYCSFGSADYSVRVPCVVQPAEARHLSAPFEGVLAATFVVPGDTVAAGQVLAVFDHRDWNLQRAELQAQWNVLEREKDRAMAADAPVEVQLALANQALVEAKLKIVESRIERASLRAPFDGLVIHGDLRKRVGDRLVEGESLFQVAPDSVWKLELEIPEHALSWVEAGLNGGQTFQNPALSGHFTGFAKPEQSQKFRITHVRPGAELRREKNVFIAEAELTSGNGESHADRSAKRSSTSDQSELSAEHGPLETSFSCWIRPGMEGVARIDVGRRPIRWIAFHRIVDYLRLRFWL